MNSFGKLSILGAVAFFGLGGTAQTQISNGDDVMSKALKVHKFNTFISLVTEAELTQTLTDRGPYTVFMPTDEAFKSFSADKLEKLRWNRASLKKFVLHHVVRGRVDAEQVVKRLGIQPMAGPMIRTEIVGGRGHLDGARFVVPNVPASNGIIHGIDKVLWPNG